jgi:hypothetical protein
MSYDLTVYTRRDQLPSPERFNSALSAVSPEIVLGRDFPDFRNPTGGMVSLSLDGEPAGFEIAASSIAPNRAELFLKDVEGSDDEMGPADREYLEILQTCDVYFVFACRGEREIRAAEIVAATLASLSGGYVSDPQKGTTTKPQANREEAP